MNRLYIKVDRDPEAGVSLHFNEGGFLLEANSVRFFNSDKIKMLDHQTSLYIVKCLESKDVVLDKKTVNIFEHDGQYYVNARSVNYLEREEQ